MTLSERDKKVIWHPYTQMQTASDAIGIVRGEDSYLFDEDGNKYIDAISSWWTNLHGHAHPYIVQRVTEQMSTLEHVLFAGFTHEPAITLAENLLKILPDNQRRIFYSDNGSTAVEVALKMAFQYWHNSGEKRKKVLAFENAYHGDTFGAMSVSGRSIFTQPFDELLFEVIYVPVPVDGNKKACLDFFKSVIKDHQPEISAFLYEPLVQGTAGMIMYNANTLDTMIGICKEAGIITIADEVMTGFGRTGKMFASDYLLSQPDIFCLSKGITGGFMAMGVTTCTSDIYDAFLSTDKTKTFFHGHSYTANPIACSAAVANLELLDRPDTWENIHRITHDHAEFAAQISKEDGVKSCRTLGTILAIELDTSTDSGYLSTVRDHLYDFFIEKKIVLRPLGNIIYLMPPYCMSPEDLKIVYGIMEEAIQSVRALQDQ